MRFDSVTGLQLILYPAEHRDQARVTEGCHADDARAVGGEHHDAVSLEGALLVADVFHRRGLAVSAGGEHAPGTGRADDTVAEEGHAGSDAGKPGAHGGRLQDGVAHQESLECGGVRVLECRDVLVEEGAGLWCRWLDDLLGGS